MNIIENEIYINDIENVTNLNLPWGDLNKKNVLLTGVTGLICSCIADVLLFVRKRLSIDVKLFFAGRDREKVVSRFLPFIEGKDFYFVYFDAINGNSLQIKTDYIDYIIHGAGNAHPKAYSVQPVETMLTNFLGVNSLLNLMKNLGGKRFLYISSSEVYGKKNNFERYMEDNYGYVDILNSRSCYPCSKRASETLCASYADEFGIDFVIVRPGHIYGPTMMDSDSRAVAQFTRDSLEGNNIIMKSAGTQKRSYCYIIDCASAIMTVLFRGKSGEAYNISNKNSIVSIKDVAEAFANISGKKIMYSSPSDSEKKGYNPMDNSSLNSEKIENLGWSAQFDISKGVERTFKILGTEQIEMGKGRY